MTQARHEALRRIREEDPAQRAGLSGTPLGREIAAAGVRFAAVGGPLEQRWHTALAELDRCIRPHESDVPVLNEGGPYDGTWIESTGTINTEVLARYAPDVARDTLLQFARLQRADGMIPYKITSDGPAWSQIQIVTPLARVVWNVYLATGREDRALLEAMYDAMAAFDAWLARYRDTQGTGGVEAFCTFDTGHDASPRFWFAPDRALGADARHVDPTAARVPYVAPDLTANVACQRAYLALIADELGNDAGDEWRARARASIDALYAQCYDAADGFFYDRDRHGKPVRIQSDVLARVLACEIGDDEFFASSLERYLMNTRKFLAHYGFTTIALDDPRFDADASRNSWAGPVNFLAQLRAPHAFEHHGRVAELATASMPTLAALAVASAFPQCMDPWSGEAGFTAEYSPAILWFLDAIERYAGVLARPDGTVWATGLAPTRLDHGAAAEATAYRRDIDGAAWELVSDDSTAELARDGAFAARFPRGWRAVCARDGHVTQVVGVAAGPVHGVLELPGGSVELELAPNERVTIDGTRVADRQSVGFVPPVL